MTLDTLRPPVFPLRLAMGLASTLALILPMMLASSASAQMQIDEIAITAGPAYRGGGFTDFFVDPVVFGTGIESVVLTSQSGTLDELLFEVTPGEFACDRAIPSEPCENFISLAQISALGNLTFTFEGDLGEVDSVTIPLADYDPGSGQTGFPDVIFPDHGQTGVATNATIQWSAPPSWVGVLAVGLEELVTGMTADEDLFFGAPVTNTTWAPSGMSAATVYEFEISFFDPIELEDPRVSTGGRDYLLTTAFESVNLTVFAVPEPGSFASLALGMVTLVGLSGRRRPRPPRES